MSKDERYTMLENRMRHILALTKECFLTLSGEGGEEVETYEEQADYLRDKIEEIYKEANIRGLDQDDKR